MSEYMITSTTDPIDFGATGAAEIVQNIRMILTTPEFSCPMARGFAWSPPIDAPMPVIQAKLAAKIISAIRQYEPRAEVQKVTYRSDPILGSLQPVVLVSIR